MQTEAMIGLVTAGVDEESDSTGGRYSRQRRQQMGTAADIIAGGLAGAVSKTCTAPLARLTILFQVEGMQMDAAALQRSSIIREASRIVHEEGFRSFWKGNLATIVHRLPYSSINFYSYEHYKNLLWSLSDRDVDANHVGLIRFLAGGLAGTTAASITYPLDLVRTRLATQKRMRYYRGIVHALYAICRDEGARGLYKGLGTTLLGVGPNIAITFSIFETLQSYWLQKRPCDSPTLIGLSCGSLSGIASSTVTFPLDLVRRRKQLEGAAGRSPVHTASIYRTFKHIICTEGFRGLYRGIWPEYCKVVPGVGILFMSNEALKSLLSGQSKGDL